MGIFFVVFVVGAIYTRNVCYPDFRSGGSAFNHYIAPVLLAIAIASFLVGRKSIKTAFILITFCLFSVFIHFNFKSWVPIINSSIHDDFLHEIDTFIGVDKAAAFFARQVFIDVDWYHSFFVLGFFVSFAICSIFGDSKDARRLNFSICLTLLIGGILYWVYPALGSFLYTDDGYRPQLEMLTINKYIRQTGLIPSGMFLEGLAAMPSLHLAHSTVFMVHSYKCKRVSCLLFIPLTMFFSVEALALGWHYSLDLVIGGILGWAITLVSYRTDFEGISLQSFCWWSRCKGLRWNPLAKNQVRSEQGRVQ